MSEVQALVDALSGLPRRRPAGPVEAEALLALLRSAAARWADILYEAGEGVRDQVPPRAEAALTLAFRRAEESYVELEIALRDCSEHRDPAI
ncbi:MULTISPECIES: hypothetical protein [Streptomyces]|uniref:Uncharacterized protein n=1 Tax=Streptomyces amritsarensis TaxID=681158 RepID=A0ABX3FSX8_9ACTN|nr:MULTISPECIES: hypothetical protein [Streptomyces]MDX6764041.1 hypothetical protein [Streptomyces sp. F8]OLZ51292.1 hypothetical protein AVW11_32075 [Streptomyces amritsarensis]